LTKPFKIIIDVIWCIARTCVLSAEQLERFIYHAINI